MKNIITFIGALFLASFILNSCGGGKTELNIKPSSTAVKGDLSDFYEVVDGTYKLEKDKESDIYKIKVQLKRKDKDFDFDAKELESKNVLNIFCDLYEENGTPVVTGSWGSMGMGEGRTVAMPNLIILKAGETGWAEFSFNNYEKLEPEKYEKVKSFGITSSVDKSYQSSSTSSGESTSSNEENVSTSNTDCDQFIKDYEAFANSYIKLLKKYKANPTDASILTEYTEAAQKAMDMQKDASNCTDVKYATKLMEIASKIAKAAM